MYLTLPTVENFDARSWNQSLILQVLLPWTSLRTWEPANTPVYPKPVREPLEWQATNSGRKLQQLHVHNNSTNYLVSDCISSTLKFNSLAIQFKGIIFRSSNSWYEFNCSHRRTFSFLLVRCTKAYSQVHTLTLSPVSIGLRTRRHGEE